MLEWRSMLGFVGQWRKVSAQSAYKLWQWGCTQVPPPPANQWMRFATGMPMANLDQRVADKEVPELKAAVIQIDSFLSAAMDQ